MKKSLLLCTIILLTNINSLRAGTFEWSGFKWRTTTSQGKVQGPGPNIFSDSSQNVFVDEQGRLHLKIIKNQKGEWTCSEVSMVEPLGYGTYMWELSKRYDTLPKNVVVGLFTYSSPKTAAEKTGGQIGNKVPDTPHEIDIEFTNAWGSGNLFYATHDPDIKSPGFNFYQKLNGDYTTHRFKWEPSKITWESFHGHRVDQAKQKYPITEERDGPDKGKIAKVVYTGPVIPDAHKQRVMINFWLFEKNAPQKGPANGESQEFVIHKFYYKPLTR